jgi:phosphoserine phosphatase
MIESPNLSAYQSKILEKLNPEISKELLRIESLDIENKIAVFDMDGTLLDGDLGEAVFCYMKANGYELNLKWRDYLDLLERGNTFEAYTQMVKSFKGINARSVMNATRNLLKTNSNEIFFKEDDIEYKYPVPVVNIEMLNLIVYLKISKWKVSAISATSHIIVKEFTDSILKLEPLFVRGIRSEFYVTDNYEDLFTEELKGEITYREGKVKVLNEIFADTKPLLTAGDSLGDIELLNSTSNDGFAILCGKSNAHLNFLKKHINPEIKTVNFIY